MKKNQLVILNGHPDPGPERFCAALCRSYAKGARGAGWAATIFNTGEISGERYAAATPDLAQALKSTCSAERIAIFLPVWLGLPPDCVTYFLRLARGLSSEMLEKIPTHVIATMDMPGFVYRNQMKKNEVGQMLPVVVALPGIHTAEYTLIGSMHTIGSSQRMGWLAQMESAGQFDTAGRAEMPYLQRLSA